MNTFVTIFFFALIISAPWISQKWGKAGAWAWGIISMGFIVFVVLVLN